MSDDTGGAISTDVRGRQVNGVRKELRIVRR